MYWSKGPIFITRQQILLTRDIDKAILSVCLSVCLSVSKSNTFRYSIEMA